MFSTQYAPGYVHQHLFSTSKHSWGLQHKCALAFAGAMQKARPSRNSGDIQPVTPEASQRQLRSRQQAPGQQQQERQPTTRKTRQEQGQQGGVEQVRVEGPPREQQQQHQSKAQGKRQQQGQQGSVEQVLLEEGAVRMLATR
jgi:hypothetical protein